ncbi:MAG: methionine--tRNA ligase [Myxococcales bacterium]|nr:methionine--tRNA ligase [Myxococcales bacterium]
MSTSKRRILVTAALPYANGDIHIGHMVEYLQTDIWCRFQRLRGNECIYLCADDAHGTPIMLRARDEGITPKELIDSMSERHQADFAGFGIQFDCYHSTHSEENRLQAQKIYLALREGGHIHTKTIEQAFDPEAQVFLPDRFIRGTCPRCKAEDQYGDSCESCGATYASSELVDPVSVVSGKTPVSKESEHYFFKLGDFQSILEGWIGAGHVQPEVRNKLKEWLDGGLRDWDISRDAPYWGFKIPDTEDKYFYVWLDAPVGYMATTHKYCESNGQSFDDYWGKDATTEVHHFLGKDIAYFHTLFWPAMLSGAGYRTPTAVYCHGFLTVNGKKMSKRRGTFIAARTYLDHLDPEYLRYYFAAKLSSGLDDIDLNLEDFEQRINSDLVGKLVNIASRTAGILGKRFESKLSASLPAPEVYEEFAAEADAIATFYEGREYSKALRKIMALADKANQYIADQAPWKLAKEEATLEQAQAVCTQGLNLYRMLITYLSPVVPRIFDDSCKLFGEELTWEGARKPLLGVGIKAFSPLLQRVDKDKVAAMAAASKPPSEDKPKEATKEKKAKKSKKAATVPEGCISFDDFSKVELRVAKIVAADHVEGADKLLQITAKIAPGDTRNIFAGIKDAYAPEDLVGRHVVVVANLAPRKMRFGMSEGMIIAAGPGGKDIFLLSPDSGATAGMVVK